mmetsp:Transcript_11164/g.21599  ORF Transcript_11164/g.21599 Transcript_11164/m.21599 type:complete len:83 (+) Transcript_11164:373-621(+)
MPQMERCDEWRRDNAVTVTRDDFTTFRSSRGGELLLAEAGALCLSTQRDAWLCELAELEQQRPDREGAARKGEERGAGGDES